MSGLCKVHYPTTSGPKGFEVVGTIWVRFVGMRCRGSAEDGVAHLPFYPLQGGLVVDVAGIKGNGRELSMMLPCRCGDS